MAENRILTGTPVIRKFGRKTRREDFGFNNEANECSYRKESFSTPCGISDIVQRLHRAFFTSTLDSRGVPGDEYTGPVTVYAIRFC